MSGRHAAGAGKSYWGDLHLIRESRKITLDEVHADMKIPISVLRDFERDGLSFHEHFNSVYRLSLVAAFAEAVGVDPVLARESYLAADRGMYDGRLATRYLSWSQPEPEDEGENASTRRGTGYTETRRERRHTRLVFPINSVRTRRSTDWRVVGALVMFVIVATALAWAVGSTDQSGASSVVTAAKSPSTTAALTISAPILGDSIEVTLVARYGVLNPLLVQIDQGKTNRYWLEIGDSMTLGGEDTFDIRGNVQNLALTVAGRELPFERFGSEGTFVLGREDLEKFLQSDAP